MNEMNELTTKAETPSKMSKIKCRVNSDMVVRSTLPDTPT